MATRQLYFEATYVFRAAAHVVSAGTALEKAALVLDRTIAHPQGGGQPADRGRVVTADGAEFVFTDVRMDRATGIIQHLGDSIDATRFAPGTDVTVEVDEPTRRLHARLHSAGHLLDSALKNIGALQRLNLTPSKGYHFPAGPYVEYIGVIPDAEKDAVQAALQAEMTRLIAENAPVEVHLDVPPSKVNEICQCEMEHGPDTGTGVRVIKMAGLGCPCGGTHVPQLGDLGVVTVTKIKSTPKKNETKISYVLA